MNELLVANAQGYVASANQKPYHLTSIITYSSGPSVNTTFQDSIVVPTDSDFVCCAIKVMWRTASSGGVPYITNNSADPCVLTQIRDSGSQGQGLFDRPIDAVALAGVNEELYRLFRPVLYRGGNTISIEGSFARAPGAAGALTHVLYGYRDYTKPSTKR